MADITLWKPEPDLIIHQALGKACEEANELAKILARCLIQGLDATDPKTGKPNRQAITEEFADLDAAMDWLNKLAGIPTDRSRTLRKLLGFEEWQGLLGQDRDRASNRLAQSIVQGVCELQEIPDCEHPDTVTVSIYDLEAVVTNRIRNHG